MHLERYGAGFDLFFGLHGWGDDHNAFAPLAPLVPARASFYSADLPGCGLSHAPRVWSVEAIVAEIIENMSAINSANDSETRSENLLANHPTNNVRRVTVVGHCGGAVFGLLAALKTEALIERVVMIDPFAYLPRYFRLFISEGFGRRAYNATFANPFGRWLTNQALRGRRDEETDLTATFNSTNHEAARSYLKLFASIDGLEQFREVRAAVDIVYGEKSFGAVRRSVAMLQNVLPHARIFQLADAGHMPIEEASEQLSQIIFEPEKCDGLIQARAQK